MALTIAQRLRGTRKANALSARQVAALAGVSPSTVVRVESGDMNPTYDLVLRLLNAVGLDERLAPVSLPSAIATARWLLGDGEVSGEADYWIERWERINAVRVSDDGEVSVPDVRSLAFRAGRSAVLAARPGAALLRHDRSWDDVADGLRRSGIASAGTGDRSANRLVPYASETSPSFYVEDVGAAIEALGLAYRAPREWGQPIVLLPFDGYSERGSWLDADGRWYAAPWQVVMDCYGGSDRLPEQADRILDTMLGEPTVSVRG